MFILLNFSPMVFIYAIGTIFCFNINYSMFMEITALPDLTTSILVDMFFTNNFYFLWTNLWYLSAYFFTINMYLTFFSNSLIPTNNFYLLILIILLIFITSMEWINNFFFVLELFSPAFNENTLLLNAINRIHPFLLHSSFFFLFLFLLGEPNTLFQNSSFVNTFTLSYLNNSIIIIIITLYLGSWWALQEGSWGGWWNWDPSEIFGLYILYRILSFYHMNENVTYTVHTRYYLIKSIIYLYIFYCTMQVNFSLVSHNFGFSSLKSFNPELFFLTSIIILSCAASLKYYSIKVNLSIIHALPIYQVFLAQIVFITCTITFYITTLLLLSNFLWNMINLKLFLITFNYNYYINATLVMLITYLCRYNLYIILMSSIYLNGAFLILILSINNFKGQTLILLVHFLLVFSLIFSYSSCYSSIDMWAVFYLNSGGIDCYNYSLNSTKIDSQFNFFSNFTAYEGKSFDLNLYNSFLWQKYFPSSVLEYYTTSLVDFYTPSLNSQVFILFMVIINTLNSRIVL